MHAISDSGPPAMPEPDGDDRAIAAAERVSGLQVEKRLRDAEAAEVDAARARVFGVPCVLEGDEHCDARFRVGVEYGGGMHMGTPLDTAFRSCSSSSMAAAVDSCEGAG